MTRLSPTRRHNLELAGFLKGGAYACPSATTSGPSAPGYEETLVGSMSEILPIGE